MFSKHLRRHGHRHVHHRNHRHGGKHEKIGGHCRNGDYRMGKHHSSIKAADFGRRCFSESELPDNNTSKQVVPRCTGRLEGRLERIILENFFKKRHHGRHGRCFFDRTDEPIQSGSGSRETHPEVDNSKDNEQNPDLVISAEVSEEQNNDKHLQRHNRFYMGHGHRNHFHHHQRHCGAGEYRRKPENVSELIDLTKEESIRFVKKFKEKGGRRHHGGRHGHGQLQHQSGRRKHGSYKIMVDAAVNTDPCEIIPNATHEPNIGQAAHNDATQQETQSVNIDQVNEVTDNLQKSSLE